MGSSSSALAFSPKQMFMKRIGAMSDPNGAISPYHGVHHVPLLAKETLVEASDVSCAVRTFRFALPNSDDVLADSFDLSLGDIVKIHEIQDRQSSASSQIVYTSGNMKSYSPTDVSTPGQFDLTVKIYPGGVNSQLFDNLEVGDRIGISGPWPPPIMRGKRLAGKCVNIVCFGVGLTEGIEVIKGELRKGEATQIRLLYAKRYRSDVIFQKELDDLAQTSDGKFRVTYMFSREDVNEHANERRGRVDPKVLQQVFDLPAEPSDPNHREQRFIVVGSKPMMFDTWKHLGSFQYNRADHLLFIKKTKEERPPQQMYKN